MPATPGSAPAASPAAGAPPKMLRTSEVAALFKVSPKTVSRWAKDGKLPYQRTLGGHRRYPQEIRELVELHEAEPPGLAVE